MSDRKSLYMDLHKAFKNANSHLNHSQCDIEVAKVWNELKTKKNFLVIVQEEIRKYRLLATEKKLTLDYYWVKVKIINGIKNDC